MNVLLAETKKRTEEGTEMGMESRRRNAKRDLRMNPEKSDARQLGEAFQTSYKPAEGIHRLGAEVPCLVCKGTNLCGTGLRAGDKGRAERIVSDKGAGYLFCPDCGAVGWHEAAKMTIHGQVYSFWRPFVPGASRRNKRLYLAPWRLRGSDLEGLREFCTVR